MNDYEKHFRYLMVSKQQHSNVVSLHSYRRLFTILVIPFKGCLYYMRRVERVAHTYKHVPAHFALLDFDRKNGTPLAVTHWYYQCIIIRTEDCTTYRILHVQSVSWAVIATL